MPSRQESGQSQDKGQEQACEGSNSQYFEEAELSLLVSFISSPDNSSNNGYGRHSIYRTPSPLKGCKHNPPHPGCAPTPSSGPDFAG